MTKWHYFDSENKGCYLDKEKVTACGLILSIKVKHTEFEKSVTCINCLRRIYYEQKRPRKR